MKTFRLACIGALALASACQPRTELLIGIATDIRAPDLLDSVQLNVSRQRDGVIEQQLPPWTISGIPNQPFNLPGSYGVYSPDGSEVGIHIELLGVKNGNTIVKREALATLVNGKSLFLRLGLVVGCMGKMDCLPGDTCIEGTCRPQNVDVTQLPDFKPELVDELTCDSGTHFINTADGTPMPLSADASQCPADLCGEGTCLKPPSDDGGTFFTDDAGANDASVGDASVDASPDMSTGLKGCPGDVLGQAVTYFSPVSSDAAMSALSGIAIDPATGAIVWTDTGLGQVVMSMDPCVAQTTTVVTNVPGAQAPAVANGNELWFVAGTLQRAPLQAASTVDYLADVGAPQFVATDGTSAYFTNGGSIDFVTPPSTMLNFVQSPIAPASPLIALAGSRLFWFDSGTSFDMGLSGLYSSAFSGGPVTLVSSTSQPSLGLVSDGTNVYWSDVGGVSFQPVGGGSQLVIVPSTLTGGNAAPRLATDGNFIYIATVRGAGADVVLQAPIMGNAPVQQLAGGQTMNTSPVNPLFVVGAHGVYWIDGNNNIVRAPTGTSITAPIDAGGPGQ